LGGALNILERIPDGTMESSNARVKNLQRIRHRCPMRGGSSSMTSVIHVHHAREKSPMDPWSLSDARVGEPEPSGRERLQAHSRPRLPDRALATVGPLLWASDPDIRAAHDDQGIP
jgi:hypothetical protein